MCKKYPILYFSKSSPNRYACCLNSNLQVADRRSHYVSPCDHSSKIKKIYLREIAVGTDSDFPLDQSQSSFVEKSHRTAFESTNDRRTNIINNCIVANNSNRYINKNHQTSKKFIFCNVQNNNGKDSRMQQRFDKKYNDNVIDKIENKQLDSNQMRNDNEENGYTPVPVKQLIQEFEKTCRPVLQYKQISPKIIPIVQQCPLDNNIARFFETRNSAKYNNEEKEYAR